MKLFKPFFPLLFVLMTTLFFNPAFAEAKVNIRILCYHNFNPKTPGWMNMTPEKLESQFKWLKENGYTFIPLQEAVDYLQGKRNSLPPKPVVVTADDGWKSVYTYLYPLALKYQIPVTLFIYPEPISHEKNFLTWDEIKTMEHSGLFDIQGHTYSHPNFKIAKRKLSPARYEQLVNHELAGSKKILEEKLGKPVTLLAWPFGIYNADLEKQAENAGYVMSFTIAALPANKTFKSMEQPRYMLLQTQSMKFFEEIMGHRGPG